MKARSLLSCAALALVGVVSAPAFAEDAKTYKLDMRDHWKVGDVATHVDKSTETQSVLVKGPDGSVIQDQKTSKTTAFKLVQKVLEVDERGQITKSLLYIASWSLESGPDKDDSLAGLHVEVTGRGKLRNWKVLTPGKMPSEGAKAWLDGEYGNKQSDDSSFEDVIAPKKEVAVGESWNPDLAELAKAFEDSFKIDEAKSSAKVTLKSVEGNKATFDLDIVLQTSAMPSPGGPLPWKEGGALTIKGTGTRSIEAGNNASGGDAGIELKGVGDAQGATVTLEVVNHKTGGSTVGGEMPEVKAAGGDEGK